MNRLRWNLIIGLVGFFGFSAHLHAQDVVEPKLRISVSAEGTMTLEWDASNLVLLRCSQLNDPIWWRVPGSSPTVLPVVNGKWVVPVYWPSLGTPATEWVKHSLTSKAQFFCVMDKAIVEQLQAGYESGEQFDGCLGGECQACVDFCKGYALRTNFLSAPSSAVGEAAFGALSLECGGDTVVADLEEIGGVISSVYHAEFGP